MTRSRREEFLSEEDLDLANCSEAELLAWWDLWLRLAQASNDLDEDEYSHGVFRRAPKAPPPGATDGACGGTDPRAR
jgi:hypothetical protein